MSAVNSEMNGNPAEEEVSPWICSANESICFKLVHSKNDVDKQDNIFHPDFTHQIFEDEKIYGYQGLKIDIYISASAFNYYIGVHYKEKLPDAVDIEKTLIEKAFTNLKLHKNLDHFIQIAEKESHDFKPPGQMIHSYQSQTSQPTEDVSFEIYKGNMNHPAVKSFHAQIQPLILFFIDASSLLEDDPSWDFYFLFEKSVTHGESKYSTAGFMAVYNFFAYPDKTRKRVSQMLILPKYQRQRHGCVLLEKLFEESRQEVNIKDVTVEDPSPYFAHIRDVVDCRNLKEASFFQESPLKSLDEETVKEIQEELKIYPEQIKRCYEIFLFRETDVEKEEDYKDYRLTVKRRLYRKYQDILSGFTNVEDRKKELDKLYQEVEMEYKMVLSKVF